MWGIKETVMNVLRRLKALGPQLESTCGAIPERPSGPPLQLAQGIDPSEIEIVTSAQTEIN
jgi:hypothetical protein